MIGSISLNKDRGLHQALERLYQRYNKRQYVHPDPLEFLYHYHSLADREIVALVASSLAYGRVAQILKSVSLVLDLLPSPHTFLQQTTLIALQRSLEGFKHRFATGEEMAALLWSARRVVEQKGSLQAAFAAGLREEHTSVLPALSAFVALLQAQAPQPLGHLLPSPHKGSACKRLHLFLRWMVRHDAVDPGGWTQIPPSKLIVPLDTHMHRLGLSLGLTTRKQANRETALAITQSFARLTPPDPVRYDFALTRIGIRKDPEIQRCLEGDLSVAATDPMGTRHRPDQ